MATRHNVRGIVLRRTEYAEADRIVTILSDELGKITAIAKGARRLQSKLAGGIELLTISEMGLLPGRSMYTLTSARIQHQFNAIAGDLSRLNFVYAVLERANKLLEDGEGQELFAVLEQVLMAMNEHVPQELVQTWFYMALVTHFGQQPNLDHDINGVELAADLRYVLQPSSGVLVPSESTEAVFDGKAIKSLRLMNRYDPRQLNQIKGLHQAVAPVMDQVTQFANYQLG